MFRIPASHFKLSSSSLSLMGSIWSIGAQIMLGDESLINA